MIEIHIDVDLQILKLLKNHKTYQQYVIATAAKGVGECYGSERTPRGLHCVRAKIGAGQPINTVFVARRPTGEIYTPELALRYPNRDWILTRILWLSGLEVAKNRLGNIDSMRRYIYIHGCPDSVVLGKPNSHGCIRMHNADILELFNLVPVLTRVFISTKKYQ